MTTAGPNSPSTVADNGGGAYSWSNPSNATSSNNSYAVCSGISDGPDAALSNRLKATGFGFAIPTGATITGVVAEFEIKAATGGSSVDVTDEEVKLVKAGTASGTNKGGGAGAGITNTEAYKSYGGSSDLWGNSLSPSDVNDSGFGVQWQGSFNEDNSSDISIDHIRITVYYTLPAIACPFLLDFI
jgi:hypothetical protein